MTFITQKTMVIAIINDVILIYNEPKPIHIAIMNNIIYK